MLTQAPDVLNTVFSALSDPTRRTIVAHIAQGDSSVTELSEPFDISAPAISRHLRVLENAGLIVRWKEGRVRYCHLMPGPLDEAKAWIERHRAFWEQQFDALAQFLDDEE